MAETLTATASEGIKIIQWRNFRESDNEDKFIETRVKVNGILYELFDIKHSFSTAMPVGEGNPVIIPAGYDFLDKEYGKFRGK